MRAMVHSPTSILLLLPHRRQFHSNSIWLTTPKQLLAATRKSTAASNAKQVSIAFSSTKKFANLVTRESKCRRITIRPWHGRYSLSGDSNQGEYSSWGVPSKTLAVVCALSRHDESRPGLGRTA